MTQHPTRAYDVAILGAGIVGCYLASRLATQGGRVALIDRGPLRPRAPSAALPDLTCVGRGHLGSRLARNHVVGGNSLFWGGGLIPNRADSLAECMAGTFFANDTSNETMRAYLSSVARALGVKRPSPIEPAVSSGPRSAHRSEMLVLLGRRRDIAGRMLGAPDFARGVDVYPDSLVEALSAANGRLREISIRSAGLGRASLSAREFVISMGVVDSILFAIRFGAELRIDAGSQVGRCLHDHWSVPIFDVTRRSPAFLREVAPRFLEGNLATSRVELRDPAGWGARGFLHFQPRFDEAPPYREIKKLLELRQKGGTPGAYARVAAGLVASVPMLAKLGMDRLMDRTVTVGKDVPIGASVDFESYPSPENRIEWTADHSARLHWRICGQDADTFSGLLAQCVSLVQRDAACNGIEWTNRVDGFGGDRAGYLEHHGIDAYHLGGGLQVGTDYRNSVLDPHLRLHGTRNVSVISTAVFARPGVANPTLTLLALAEWYAAHAFEDSGVRH